MGAFQTEPFADSGRECLDDDKVDGASQNGRSDGVLRMNNGSGEFAAEPVTGQQLPLEHARVIDIEGRPIFR